MPGQEYTPRVRMPHSADAAASPLVPPPLPVKVTPASSRFRRRHGVLQRIIAWLVLRQPGWLTSFLVHLLLLLILGLLIVPAQKRPSSLTLTFGEQEPEFPVDTLALEAEEPAAAPEEPPLLESQPTDFTPIAVPDVALPTFPSTSEQAPQPAAPSTMATSTDTEGRRGGFSGRAGRRGTALSHGATAESEEAVDRALVWLAAHQQPSGRWSFDLRDCNCDGLCDHPGLGMRAVNGATALALLPFLGAGQTHEQGYHQKTIAAGLRYLLDHQGANGSFHEQQGTMYSHGLATLVLCESLAMTRTDPGGTDQRYRRQPELQRAAQRAIDFIVRHQHPGGGWRYVPGEKGDTSVVGWQAMALQSAKMAGLDVPKRTLERTSRFLDTVMADTYGGQYGYLDNRSRPGTSAVGVLSRMYLGWDRTHPGIIAGAEYLDQLGPSANNVYFNYYATQAMHHFGGPLWEEWHPALRDHLVDTQQREGHSAGSWYFDGDFGSIVGGRLYITAMSTMILEVYYRHMPIYSESAVAQAQTLAAPE
jgi:hypothetical protein